MHEHSLNRKPHDAPIAELSCQIRLHSRGKPLRLATGRASLRRLDGMDPKKMKHGGAHAICQQHTACQARQNGAYQNNGRHGNS